MSSFYGGKQGRTYHIVQRYDSVADMVDAFSGGGAYTKANYGQYVIIDTVLNEGRSSSLENGLLYRRGFDYNDSGYGPKPIKTASMTDQEFHEQWVKWVQNPGAGAIYVGQIVGPEGRTPELSIQHWTLFQEQIAHDGNFGSKSEVIMTPTVTGKLSHGLCRHADCLVRGTQARPALARRIRPLQNLGFRNHPTADPRAAGLGLLSPFYRQLPECQGVGRVGRAACAESVAGTRLLLPCPQHACCRSRDYVETPRGFSECLR